MPVTSPDNIWYTQSGDNYSAEAISAQEASSVQAAVGKRQIFTYRWPSESAMGDQSDMQIGDLGVRQDLGVTYRWSGTEWNVFGNSEWTSYTPSLSNITLGNGGSINGRYRWNGKQIQAKISIILGSSGFTVNTNPTVTLPVPSVPPAGSNQTYNGVGTVQIGGDLYPLFILYSGTSQTIGRLLVLKSNDPGYAQITASYPQTWAGNPNNKLIIEFQYEPA